MEDLSDTVSFKRPKGTEEARHAEILEDIYVNACVLF